MGAHNRKERTTNVNTTHKAAIQVLAGVAAAALMGIAVYVGLLKLIESLLLMLLFGWLV